MSRFFILKLILAGLLASSPAIGSTSPKPDPVVLTFSSEAGRLGMELGFIEELRLEPSGDRYSVRVIFEYEGVKYYNSFAFPNRDLMTDLIICNDKVHTYTRMPYLTKGSFVLPKTYSKAEAEKVLDLLFYGENCENYMW